MPKRRILWQLYPSYLFITIAALTIITWYVSRNLHDYYFKRTLSDLQVRAGLIGNQVIGHLAASEEKRVDSLCKALGRISACRITVILPSGVVIGDSEDDPDQMENHSGRPEVSPALSGQIGTSTRYSSSVNKDLLYLAVPLGDQGHPVGVIRLAVPVVSVDRAISAVRLKILLAAFIVAILMAAISYYISRRLSRPLVEIKEGAERFARGALNTRLPIPDQEEIGALAMAMNDMAANLNDRIGTITRQRNEREAILAGMVEGVLAIDINEKVSSINGAAARMIGVDPALAPGKSIQELIRNPDLQQLTGRVLKSRESASGEIVLSAAAGQYLQVHGTVLRDADGENIGALIVLNDITRLKKLENVRREFVANVSHELKTPITSIKGFVETLLEGALRQPEDAERFLKIIENQVDRLNRIIDDLLGLSRIEKEADAGEIILEPGQIYNVLANSVKTCREKAESGKIELILNCDENILSRINETLLEQAVVNLIDNAIKYSEPGSAVKIEANRSDKNIIIEVIDSGCGIEKEHLPRLFERFYRVDKARSRSLGGTGLGLAIAKHIVLAHGGTISVKSTPGQGSNFTISLPAA